MANESVTFSDGNAHERIPEIEIPDLIGKLNPTDSRNLIVYVAADETHWANLLCLSDDPLNPTGSFVLLDHNRARLPIYTATRSQLYREEYALRMALQSYRNYLQQSDFELICPSNLLYSAISGSTPTVYLNFARFAFSFIVRVASGDNIPDILNPNFMNIFNQPEDRLQA